MRNSNYKTIALTMAFAFIALLPIKAYCDGLIRSIWSCRVPCEVKNTREMLSSIQVSYCSTSVLSSAMVQNLTAICRAKNNRDDAIAVRATKAEVATCDSSSNPCPKEGLTRAGFTCRLLCPSEDQVIHKFTACATNGDEAWSHATEICKDATLPESSYLSPSKNCIAEGQTPCE